MKNSGKSNSKRNHKKNQREYTDTDHMYFEVLRKMDGEKRLKTSFELYEIALNLCKQNILEQNPNISKEKLKEILFERFGYGPGRFADKNHR